MKKRVVIAGLGETGLLVALGLHPDFDVIGISPKLAVVSGQELGTRIARPRDWQENYLTDFSRYRKLRGMAIRHGLITSLTPDQNQLAIQNADGTEETLTYDALVLSMGVTSGFWRSAASPAAASSNPAMLVSPRHALDEHQVSSTSPPWFANKVNSATSASGCTLSAGSSTDTRSAAARSSFGRSSSSVGSSRQWRRSMGSRSG